MGFIRPSLSGCCRKKPSEQVIEGCMIAKTQAKDGNEPAKVVNHSTRGSKKTKSEKTHKRQEVTKNIEKIEMEKEMVTELENFLTLSTDARSSLYVLNTCLHDASQRNQFMIKQYQATQSWDYVRATITNMYNNLEMVGGAYMESNHLCFSMSTETKAMLENNEVWENKFEKMVKCIDTYKLVIKLASGTILIGLACVMIAMPQMLPVVIASGTIVKTFGDWLTTLCKMKQKELNIKKEKIFQVKQDIVEAGLDCKLKMIVEEFERVVIELVALIEPVEDDVEGVMEDLVKAVNSIEELKMQVTELLPVIEKVVASVQDVITYIRK